MSGTQVMPWSILELLRKDPEKLKQYISKRGLDPKIVDEALTLDTGWRKLLTLVNKLRHEHNVISRKIPQTKDPENKDILIKKAKELLAQLREHEERLKTIEEKREKILLSLPNIVHETVPEGLTEEHNVPIRYWGKIKVWEGYLEKLKTEVLSKQGPKPDYEVIDWKPIGHADMLENVLKLGDTLRAAKVAGSRFYYLLEDLVWLDMALLLYALDKLSQKGYKIIIPPYMVNRRVINGVVDVDTFKDAIYKIEEEDLYLIATSEHPIAAFYMNEEVYEENLPLKFLGISPCFRREAGAGNRDLKGIFRVHQFHKVEQFVFALPEDSWKILEELIKNAEELFQGLGLPYRVVNVCAGELGAPAAKKYDLEVWMPAQGRYREMVSASNCTDWQSYRLNIRYIRRKGMIRGYVHTLNSTAIASTRTITAILENYQEPDGRVIIPRVLKKYLEIFPAAPKDYIEPRKNKI